MRRSTKIRIVNTILIVSILVISCGVTAFVFIRNLRSDYDSKIDDLNQELASNKRNVLLVTKNIKSGDVINQDNTVSSTIYSSLDQNLFISQNDFGTVSLVDIPVDAAIQKFMITDTIVDDSLREEEFTSIYLNSNLQKNDFVDIRIAFPNGENYIVASKKAIKDFSLADCRCFLWLNEEEILLLSSALVDAYLNEGTLVYTAKYIEPNIQNASISTYTPRQSVIDLIKKDPNIVSIASEYLSDMLREEIDIRLDAFMSQHSNNAIQFKDYMYNSSEISDESDPSESSNEPSSFSSSNDSNEVLNSEDTVDKENEFGD